MVVSFSQRTGIHALGVGILDLGSEEPYPPMPPSVPEKVGSLKGKKGGMQSTREPAAKKSKQSLILIGTERDRELSLLQRPQFVCKKNQSVWCL